MSSAMIGSGECPQQQGDGAMSATLSAAVNATRMAENILLEIIVYLCIQHVCVLYTCQFPALAYDASHCT